MSKGKNRGVPHYRLYDITRGMEYAPTTPPGKTALEHRAAGPFRPGKTSRDWGSK